MAEMQNNKILLESGTNEMEIMEFTIGGNLYGINVAKVKEIMISAAVKPMPHAHPAVEGIFKPRDAVITVVDLPKYLYGESSGKGEKDIFIITNFNKMFIAFRVHAVVRISRISWTDIQKPDKTVSGGAEGVATGIAQCGDRPGDLHPDRGDRHPGPPQPQRSAHLGGGGLGAALEDDRELPAQGGVCEPAHVPQRPGAVGRAVRAAGGREPGQQGFPYHHRH